MNISLKSDSLFATAGDKKFWLHHNNYDVFDLFLIDPEDGIDTLSSESLIKLQFQLNASGDVESATAALEAGVKPIEFKKQIAVKEIPKEELKKYIGEYEISGATVKIFLKNDTTLYALVPGQPEYQLLPVDKDKFAIKVLSGYFIQFTEDQKDKITGLTFIQPNGNFKATKKQ